MWLGQMCVLLCMFRKRKNSCHTKQERKEKAGKRKETANDRRMPVRTSVTMSFCPYVTVVCWPLTVTVSTKYKVVS